MSAPTPSTGLPPDGRKLGEGFPVRVVFKSKRDVAFWPKSVTPPGLEGDAEIDTATQLNVKWRTKSPRSLVTMTPFSMTAMYDPAVYVDIVNLINKPDTVTVDFPDGANLCFYGFMKSFKPGSLEEGKMPDATIEVVPTNQDPVTCEEEGPVYTGGTGTASSC